MDELASEHRPCMYCGKENVHVYHEITGQSICFECLQKVAQADYKRVCKFCGDTFNSIDGGIAVTEFTGFCYNCTRILLFQYEYALDLRTMPYPQYLKTDHWHNKREEALYRAGNRCQLCSSGKYLHVHHNNYDNRGAERPEDLIVLCRECHAKYHDKVPV